MPWHLTLDEDTYAEARETFEWDLPDGFNAVWDFLHKHDDLKGHVALFQAYQDGRRETYTFHDIDVLSNKLANAFEEWGVERGDRVGIVLPQKPANPITHLATWKRGAVSVPLSILFGEQGLQYRLDNSGAKAVVIDQSVHDTMQTVSDSCPNLDTIVEVDGDDTGKYHRFESVLDAQSRHHNPADIDAETTAFISYTSGSTGNPKGVVHTHSTWAGHYPGFSMYFERDLLDKAVVWTPADWAWLGALGDAVFPAWHYQRPVVGYPMGRFDPETAYELLEEFGVTDAFLPPTAIRMMMSVERPAERYDLALEAIGSGGEPLTPEILEWAEEALEGVAVNELYGLTEANLLVSNCQGWFEAKPGSMGKAPPGHDVAIVDSATGEELPRDEIGEIAVRVENDPVTFEEYWQLPEKTAEVMVGGWFLTGDLGYQDDHGHFWYKSRKDDVIITSGYRVGPLEVEEAILEHPDVAQVGVIGIPDDTRGEIIKAFVELRDGAEPSEDLRESVKQLVRDQLAKYEYPREIEFLDELPQTTSGKIRRVELRDIEGIS